MNLEFEIVLKVFSVLSLIFLGVVLIDSCSERRDLAPIVCQQWEKLDPKIQRSFARLCDRVEVIRYEKAN